MIKLIQTFLQISSLFRSSQLVIKGSKFVPFCGHPSVELGQQAFPHQKLYVVLAFSAYPSVSIGMYCNATYCNPEVVVLKKFSCRRLLSEWTMDILHFRGISPQRKLKCIKMLNRTVLSAVVVLVRAVDLYPASTGIGCRFRSSRDSTPSVRLSRGRAWLLETHRLDCAIIQL